MRVAVCAVNSASGYSGGRYHAWMMTEALASRGHQVTVWTNNVPAFLEDFSSFPGHPSIELHRSPDFRHPPTGPFDVVVLIPHRGEHSFFPKVLLLARRHRARLVLLNFETPNWFNELSPEPKDASLWSLWVEASRVADLILSLAAESTRYARDFYTDTPSWTLFRHCYPGINSLAADEVGPGLRERQIICITRFVQGERHKGGRDLLNAVGPGMACYKLAILIGTGTADPDFKESLVKRAKQFGITVRFLHRLSDREKFWEIKRSALMLFLSYFEGFGYPPVEALYCGVPCIAYDLPVLREVSGEGLIYVAPGDVTALQDAIHKVLAGEHEPPVPLSEHIAPVARFEAYANRLEDLMQELAALPNEPGVVSASAGLHWRWQLVKCQLQNKRRWVRHAAFSAVRRVRRKLLPA